MKRKIIVKQDYAKECGSACLLSIIRYYGGNILLDELVKMTNTEKEGTSFYNIGKAAKELGLNSRSYKITNIESLYKIKKPYIAQTIYEGYSHFVVVYNISNNKVIIMNPAKGKEIMPLNDFLNIWTNAIIVFEPQKTMPNIKEDKIFKNNIINTLKENKLIIITILFLSILFAIAFCFHSLLISMIINRISNSHSNSLIIIIILLAVIVIKNLSDYIRNYYLLYLEEKIDFSLMINTFLNILLLPYNYYKDKTTGEITSRIKDLISIRNLICKTIVVTSLDIIVLIISSIILLNISIKMYLILIIVIMCYFIVMLLYKNKIEKLTNITQENNAKLNSFLVENIRGFETIKGLHIENIINDKLIKLYNNIVDKNLLYGNLINQEIFIKSMINNSFLALILFIGLAYSKTANLNITSIILFCYLSSYILDSAQNIIELNKEYYYAKNSYRRIQRLLNAKKQKFIATNNNCKGEILIKNLNFFYNNDKRILNNLNLKIKNNEKVLILGSSGEGKSTLLKILYRYYEIEKKKILINRVDINDYGLEDIRSNICYISQNETLYTDTIKNNIMLDRNIDYDTFIKVCKTVCIEEIVKDKLIGYDTMLEEDGANLSGGQRQRIVLARYLVAKRNIMLLDESFSEMDINLERRILKNIFSEYKNRTIIIVSHRTENIDLYNKIIKIKNGKATAIRYNK